MCVRSVSVRATHSDSRLTPPCCPEENLYGEHLESFNRKNTEKGCDLVKVMLTVGRIQEMRKVRLFVSP